MKRLQYFLLIVATNALPASFGGATLVPVDNDAFTFRYAESLRRALEQMPARFASCNVPDPTSTTLDVFNTHIKESGQALPLLEPLHRQVQQLFPALSTLKKSSPYHEERVYATIIALTPGLRTLSIWHGALRRSVAYDAMMENLRTYDIIWKTRCHQIINNGVTRPQAGDTTTYEALYKLRTTALNTLLDLNASQFQHPRLPDGFEAQIRKMCDELQRATAILQSSQRAE